MYVHVQCMSMYNVRSRCRYQYMSMYNVRTCTFLPRTVLVPSLPMRAQNQVAYFDRTDYGFNKIM